MSTIKIQNILPKSWKCKIYKNTIRVWYRNSKGRQPAPITLKKDIYLSKELGILLGFWAGDGTKGRFGLTNTNLLIIKYLYKVLIADLKIKKLKLVIRIPTNFLTQKNRIVDEAEKEFPKIKINSSIYPKERNYPIYILKNDSIVLIKIFVILYNRLCKKTLFKNSFWEGYLKGIIAAEGHVHIRKDYKTLSKIYIAQEDEEIRNFIMLALKARNIIFSTNPKCIVISGKNNFDIIFNKQLCFLHPEKKKQFIKGYNNIKQDHYSTKKVESMLLEKFKKPKRISTIAREIKRCRQNVREHMLLKKNSLFQRSLIKRCGRERGRRGSFYGDLWIITQKGLKALDKQLL